MSTTPATPSRLGPDAVAALLLDTTPWLSCEDCFERMDTYAEAVASDAGSNDPAMTAHLRGCPACAEEAATLIELVAASVD